MRRHRPTHYSLALITVAAGVATLPSTVGASADPVVPTDSAAQAPQPDGADRTARRGGAGAHAPDDAGPASARDDGAASGPRAAGDNAADDSGPGADHAPDSGPGADFAPG